MHSPSAATGSTPRSLSPFPLQPRLATSHRPSSVRKTKHGRRPSICAHARNRLTAPQALRRFEPQHNFDSRPGRRAQRQRHAYVVLFESAFGVTFVNECRRSESPGRPLMHWASLGHRTSHKLKQDEEGQCSPNHVLPPGTEKVEKSRFSCGQGYTEGRSAVKGQQSS